MSMMVRQVMNNTRHDTHHRIPRSSVLSSSKSGYQNSHRSFAGTVSAVHLMGDFHAAHPMPV